ncbi:unnamed protein product, partial [Tetraodon nigroviridis]
MGAVKGCQTCYKAAAAAIAPSRTQEHLRDSTAAEMLLSVFLVLGICLVPAHSSPGDFSNPFLQRCFNDAKKLVDDAYTYSESETGAQGGGEPSRHPSPPEAAPRRHALGCEVCRLHEPNPAPGAGEDAPRSQTLHQRHRSDACARRSASRSTPVPSSVSHFSRSALQRGLGQAVYYHRMRSPRAAAAVCDHPEHQQVPHHHQRLQQPKQPSSRGLKHSFHALASRRINDGISQPKGFNNATVNNFLLPLVRQVSNNILSTTDDGVVNDPQFTHMVTLFGQWNDHDLTFTPFSPSIRSFSNGVNCDESCEQTEPCIPIPIPRGDPRFTNGPDNCIPAFRSAPVCGTGFSAYNFGGEPNRREQINALTAFLDLSQVYGSEEKLALNLRNLTNDGGLLRVNTEFKDNGRDLLPFHPLQVNMCATRKRITNDTNAREVPCFIAGDVRVDENIALTSIHTLFVREHNRLARELKRLNPQWDSETLYQETRKIMGAYTQVFVFQDYLPHIVGTEAMRRQLGRYPGYNPNVDPSISNVFATAAYRFAHLAIQPMLSRLDANYRENSQFPSVSLFKAFFTPWRVIFEGGIDPLLRGLIGRPAKLNTQDHMLVNALREKLFQFVQHVALDLGSLNMQRGRDHALPGYNAWRRFCGLSQPRNQQELALVLNNTDLARRLLQLYGTPDNIDVWLGGVAEPFVRDGRVGPLFACLIATQFQRIRQGDRLWYENPGVFSSSQRSALSRASLSRIICDNTGITSVPQKAFDLISSRNRLVRCSAIPQLNLAAWRE